MYKNLILISFVLLTITGCKAKSDVYFSSQPITSNSIPEQVFLPNQKINFLLLTNKPFISDTVKMQIIKYPKDVPNHLGINIAQAKDYYVNKQSKYLTGGFTLYQPAKYFVRFFGNGDNYKPMAEKYIWVQEEY